MPKYYAQVGNTPDLSQLELEALGASHISPITSWLLSYDADSSPEELLAKSGGLVKVFTSLFQTFDPSALEDFLVEQLSQSKKPEFAVTSLIQDAAVTNQSVKHLLKKKGISSRYHETTSKGLPSAILNHQNIAEFLLIQDGETYHLLQTKAVQNIANWVERDREKPYFDRKKGMLPPKVARMLVNIATASRNPKETLVYDPFCGSGTILLEALVTGFSVVGSDLDRAAVEGSNKNIEWLAQKQPFGGSYTLLQHNAAEKYPADFPQVSVLVTEPYLGKPRPQPKQLAGIFKGLSKQYLGAFKRWQAILEDGASLVVIFPSTEDATGTQYNLSHLIDKLDALGYTVTSGPVLYARAKAQIQRSIYVFNYKK